MGLRKVWQYQEQVNGISDTQGLERSTPDKWQPNTNTPQTNWNKAKAYSLAAIAPAVFFTNVFPQAPVNLDAWYKNTATPRYDVKKNQHLYPAFTTDSLSLTQPEIPKLFTQQQVVVSVPRLTQYQALAYPVAGFSPQETITIDKWQENNTLPVFRAKLKDLSSQVSPLQVSEVVTLDKWLSLDSLPRSVKRNQHLYPSSFFHPEPQEITDFESPSEFARNTDRVYDRERLQYLYPSTFFNPEPKEATEFVSGDILFQESSIVPGVSRKPQIPSFFSEDGQPVPRLDSWFNQTSEPRFDVRRNQHLNRSVFFHAEPQEPTDFVSGDILFQEATQIDRKLRQAHLYSYLFQDSQSLTNPEAVSLDKWQQRISEPRFNVQQTQYQHPSSFFDSSPLPNAEVISIDKWFTATSQTQRVRAIIPIDQASVLFVAEDITLDKWFSETQLPEFPKNTKYLYLSYTVERFTNVVPLDQWFVPTQQPIFLPKLRPTSSFFILRVSEKYRDKYTRRGTVHTDKYTPRNTSYSDKYPSPNTSYSDKYSSQDSSYSDKYIQHFPTWDEVLETWDEIPQTWNTLGLTNYLNKYV